MPETGADRALAFTCDASGANPQLTLLDTTNYQAIYSRPIAGLPVVSGAGVNGIGIAGSRLVLAISSSSTGPGTLAFIDKVPL